MWTISLRNALLKLRLLDSREDVNQRLKTEEQDPVFADSLVCALCGKDSHRTGLCYSGLLHTHFLTFLEMSKERRGLYYDLLPPRTVHVSLKDADEICKSTTNAIARAESALLALHDEESL